MKNLIVLFTFIITLTALGQSSSTIELEKKKVTQALTYGDQAVATNAMYNIIALEGNKSTYIDSLAYLYFNRRSYLSCYLVSADALKNNPSNVELLEMSAFSLESLSAKEKAIETYQTLLPLTNNNYHGYKIAALQFETQKLDEAYASIKKADQMPDKGTEYVAYPINQKYNQNVDLKAAIAYLEGVIAMTMEKNAEAKVALNRAITIFPDFILAKEKLEAIEGNE